MPRILLLLFSLSVMTMMFIVRCGFNMDHAQQRGMPEVSEPQRMEELMWKKEQMYQAETEALNRKINSMEHELNAAMLAMADLSTKLAKQNSTFLSILSLKDQAENRTKEFQKFIAGKIESAEVLHGLAMKTEYEVVAFNRFTLNRIFLVDPGLGKRVVEKPIGFRKKDLLEIINYAIADLNSNKTSAQKKYLLEDFLEGTYRTEPTSGSHYELLFRDVNVDKKSYKYTKVVLVRPFGPLQLVHRQTKDTSKEWINLILPLSGRIATFKVFIERYIQVCIKQDKRVFLTVVYFGADGLKETKLILSQTAKHHKYKHIKLVTLNEKFSRGRALQAGVMNWKNGDTLIFMCDVDIVFSTDFLERCRLNTERENRVYYPIVFSLYNPNVVYSLQDMVIPPEKDQLVISKDTGFWRDFGYGMTCQYRSDFMKLKGFDEHIEGWGGEDVFLYQKYVRSDYMVIRATDPSIFHLWHEKMCDPNLKSDQYRSCIRSKALNEASHAQLGLLAFKDEVDVHRSFKKHNGQ